MNKELMEALDVLEKEKEISKETLFEAIENSLMTACKNHFGKADNVHVEINRETCDFLVYAEKEVVPTKDDVEDDCLQIALEDAQEISKRAQVGDMIHVEIKSKEFGRIATQNAKNVILQKIREEERSVIYNQYYEKEKDVVTGVVQRYVGKNISINLGKADAMLTENEQVKGEVFKPTERIKVYIVEVKNTPEGTPHQCQPYPSGTGKETVRVRSYRDQGRYRGDQEHCQRGRKPYQDRCMEQ